MLPGLLLLGFARVLQIARSQGAQPKQNPEFVGLVGLALASAGLFEYRQCNEEAAKREQQEKADRA